MSFDAVVADANVLLSAALGKAASRVIHQYGVVAHVAEHTLGEVESYLPRLSSKYKLPEEVVQLQWKLLPLVPHDVEAYPRELEMARGAMEGRDPDDAHVLALAWALELPIWSNDRDFETQDVALFPTARLLRSLEEDNL